MATKTISITDDVYHILLRNKLQSESFSDELKRVFTKKKSIMEFAGAWSNITDKEAQEMKTNIEKFRKGFSTSLRKRLKENDLS